MIRVWRVLFAIAVTLSVWVTTPPSAENGGFDSDAQFYARLVGAPLFSAPSDVPPPYVYRVLTPQIVSLLPGPLLSRFRLVAIVADVTTLVLLFELFAVFGVGVAGAVFGTLLYAGVFWTLKFSLLSAGYIDHVTAMLLVGFVWLTAARRYVLATLVLAVSALQKESLPLFGVFLAADVLLNSHGWKWRRLLTAAAGIVVPLAVVILVRRVVGVQAGGEIRNILREGWRLLHPLFWPVFLHTVFSGLGLIPVLLIVRRRPWLELCRQRPSLVVFLALALACLLGGVDKGRLFLYSLAVLILLTGVIADSMHVELGSRFWVWGFVFLLAHWYLGNCLTPIGPRPVFMAKLVPEHVYAAPLVHLARLYLVRDCALAAAVLIFTLWISAPRRPMVSSSKEATPGYSTFGRRTISIFSVGRRL